MNLSPTILGTTAVEQLQKSAADAVLHIGSDKLTRHDLAGVECFNFVAARNLSQVLQEQLQVKSLKDVFDNVPPSALAVPRVGVIALAVLGAAFEARGLGGDSPLENWVRRHAAKPTNGGPVHLTTFYTIKKHEQQQAAEAKRSNGHRRRRR